MTKASLPGQCLVEVGIFSRHGEAEIHFRCSTPVSQLHFGEWSMIAFLASSAAGYAETSRPAFPR